MFYHKKIIYGLCLTVGAFLVACSQTESTQSPVTNSDRSESGRTIHGTSQKGPFVKGASVTLYEMDENLNQTGATYSTTIDNDLGNYTLKNVSLEGHYAWLSADGYYTDELTGKKSDQKISLNSLVDLDETKQANINILTHLSFDRILYLVKEGKTVAEAKKQAESEVMKAFGFGEEESSFEQLDIFQGSEGDAKLLAASLMMLIADYGGDITERMANIAFDLETDGTWDNDSLKEWIQVDIDCAGHRNDFQKVAENLTERSNTEIQNFVKYLKQFQGNYGDTLWGTCTKEDEIAQGVAGAFDQLYICYNSRWERYRGARNAGDAPIDTSGRYGTFTDSRDGNTYKTVIYDKENGEKVTWMLDMLNYSTPRHITEENDGYAAQKQYNILEAYNVSSLEELNASFWEAHQINQGICPDGWHIPSHQDFIDVFGDFSQQRVRYNQELMNYQFYEIEHEGGGV